MAGVDGNGDTEGFEPRYLAERHLATWRKNSTVSSHRDDMRSRLVFPDAYRSAVAHTRPGGAPVGEMVVEAFELASELDRALHDFPSDESGLELAIWSHRRIAPVVPGAPAPHPLDKEAVELWAARYLAHPWFRSAHLEWCVVDALTYWEVICFLADAAQRKASLGVLRLLDRRTRAQWDEAGRAMEAAYRDLQGPVLSAIRVRERLRAAEAAGVRWTNAVWPLLNVAAARDGGTWVVDPTC